MSGYDATKMSHNAAYRLMNGRFGYTDRQNPLSEPLVPSVLTDDNDNVTDTLDPKIEGIVNQRVRLIRHGGVAQQERMIYDKRRSLDSALLYSYQGANISKVGDEQNSFRALINPNKLKMDYDDKIVSVGYEYGLQPGDVFHWLGTNTYWLIYLQDITELAYFRGNIRKCSYQVHWKDEDGLHSSWIALRGPVETKIDYIQKHQISIDKPNYTLNILMPKTEAALKYFQRYAKFYLQDSDSTCWRVTAVDHVATPGIIEFTAIEYYANEDEDDIENGLVGVLKPIPIDPNEEQVNRIIQGETFIKPYIHYYYQYVNPNSDNSIYEWSIDNDKKPIELAINPNNPCEVQLIWRASYSGQFKLLCNGVEKIIIVESLT